MRLEELGEFSLIDRIAALTAEPSSVVRAGIGDDAAVLELAGDERLLVTTDAFVEDVHFRRQWLTPTQIGARAAGAALSDIAAMGGRPIAVLVSAGWPPSLDVAAAQQLIDGLAQVGGRYGAALAGGDTAASPGGIFIDVIVIGTVRQPWLRSTAQPGDVLLVTGSLGEAAAALALLQSEVVADAAALPVALRERFANPTPRLAVAEALAELGAVTAAIDISDGLVQDAGHLARSSRAAITIEADRLPISPPARRAAQQLGADPLQWALTSGEEYELLLTVAPDLVQQAAELVADKGGTTLTPIGQVSQGEGVVVLDESGEPLELPTSGWNHFGQDE